jgi:hypothetical protein
MFEDQKKIINDAADEAVSAAEEDKGRIERINSTKGSALKYLDNIAESGQAKAEGGPNRGLIAYVDGVVKHFVMLIEAS